MDLWIKVLEVIFPVMIVVFAGYLFGRITRIDLKSINLFIMYVSTPCLIFSSIIEGKVSLNNASEIVITGTTIVLICLLISYFFLRIAKKDLSIFLNPIIFPNTANLGLPLILFAFGETALDYAIIFTTVVFFLHSSLGIFILNGSKKMGEIFKAPLVYAVIIPIIFNKTGISIDSGINTSIKLLGTTCIPLMMFSLGHKLSETKILNLREDFIISTTRILLGIILSVGICYLLKVDDFISKILILQYSMPAAVFNFILADRYNRSPEKIASIVFVSTIISIPIIPIILYYLMQ